MIIRISTESIRAYWKAKAAGPAPSRAAGIRRMRDASRRIIEAAIAERMEAEGLRAAAVQASTNGYKITLKRGGRLVDDMERAARREIARQVQRRFNAPEGAADPDPVMFAFRWRAEKERDGDKG